jgi:GTP cyclohydrolase-4
LDSHDVHRDKPQVRIPLEKVGVVGIRMPVSFTTFRGKRVVLLPVFEVFVDLPTMRRGIHASRSYEVISEVFSEFVKSSYKIEDLCAGISTRLLERHDEATRTEVRARAEAVVDRTTPVTRIETYEPYTIFARAISKLTDSEVVTKRRVGARAVGITACPCVKESMDNLFTNRILENGSQSLTREQTKDLLSDPPTGTHMQRCVGSILMDSPQGYNVDLTDIIRIIEESASAPTYELLKRPDELEMVIKALETPRFVEDSIRYMAKGILETYGDLPDNTHVSMRMRSAESIHKHDMVAVRRATLGELRNELKAGNTKRDDED